MRHTIEAVTICIGYGDFLRETIPFNRPHFSRLIVVTSPSDTLTRDVCRATSTECILSDEHDRDGPFSKGRLIDRGLAHLSGRDWLLHVDADVALPHDFGSVLDDAHLDPNAIHGCDRFNVNGWEAWNRVKARGLWCRTGPWMVELNRKDCVLGARVANVGHGYTPIGAFQLWHGETAQYKDYPAKRYPRYHGTAARTDVQHSLQWDRRKRILIPELVVWHLESEKAKMGANWRGRKTKEFTSETYC